MQPIEVLWIVLVFIFGAIGLVRGFLKELGVTTAVFVAIYVISQWLEKREVADMALGRAVKVSPTVFVALAADDPRSALVRCTLYILLMSFMVFISYHGETISFGGSLFWGYGFFGGVDYGFHDAISGGGAVALLVHPFYDEVWLPVVARAAFHPFNLRVLADKIPVRGQVDPYVGLATGWKFIDDPTFRFREYIGVRYFFTEHFFGLLEEGSGLGNGFFESTR